MTNKISEEFKATQKSVNDIFEQNWAARDAVALCRDYYTNDAMMSGDGFAIIVGMDNLIEAWKAVMADSPFSDCPTMHLEPVYVDCNETLAWDVGRFYFYPGNPSDETFQGRYHLGWRKELDQGWRVHIDFWTKGQLD